MIHAITLHGICGSEQSCRFGHHAMDLKTKMLVPNTIGAHGKEAVFLLSHLIGTSHKKMMTLMYFQGPKPNFFSLTVCKLDQNLKN